MSQYPGGQPPPQDPYYGQQGADPYAPPPPAQQPSDPYFGQTSGDPAAQQPQDPGYTQQQAAAYAQQQAYYAQQQAWQAQQQAASAPRRRGRGGSGAAIIGILLVLVGIWILFGDEIDLDFGQIWPIAAVVIGAVMVVAAFIPRGER